MVSRDGALANDFDARESAGGPSSQNHAKRPVQNGMEMRELAALQ
jgi:hypothetical protein